jgi:hypothetical protein
MAQRESILPPLSNSIYIKIRQDFLELCEGDHCMASLLSYYEYKLNSIISNIEERKLRSKSYNPSADDYFIECSPNFLSKALLGLFGRTKIIQANTRLHELNFITIKTEKIDNEYKTTRVALNIEPIKKSLFTLFENEQALIQKRITPYSETNNPLFENEQPPYSKTNRINNTTNKKKERLNKKEQYLFDFDSDFIAIFDKRPKIEMALLYWVDYKFDVKKKPYSTTKWLNELDKYSDNQIIESIRIAIAKEYQGFFPESVKPEQEPTTKIKYVRVRMGLAAIEMKEEDFEKALREGTLNCDNPIIEKRYEK